MKNNKELVTDRDLQLIELQKVIEAKNMIIENLETSVRSLEVRNSGGFLQLRLAEERLESYMKDRKDVTYHPTQWGDNVIMAINCTSCRKCMRQKMASNQVRRQVG